jgi:hypothetical protein
MAVDQAPCPLSSFSHGRHGPGTLISGMISTPSVRLHFYLLHVHWHGFYVHVAAVPAAGIPGTQTADIFYTDWDAFHS